MCVDVNPQNLVDKIRKNLTFLFISESEAGAVCDAGPREFK